MFFFQNLGSFYAKSIIIFFLLAVVLYDNIMGIGIRLLDLNKRRLAAGLTHHVVPHANRTMADHMPKMDWDAAQD